MQRIIEEYAPAISEWARRKLGAEGEDLAQEVLMQVCVALHKERAIDDMERYVWKIARYTWCNWLRGKKRTRLHCELTETAAVCGDFAETLAESAAESELKARLRREISNLIRQERELMVAHYIDGLPVAEAARRAGLSETAAAWRLHEARRKVRDRLMKNIENYSYRPGRLHMGISGDPGTGICDAFQISGNLIRENICLICYGEPRSAGELAKITGVPMCYLERDIEWLHEREFLTKTGQKYQTAFPIYDTEQSNMLRSVYEKLTDSVYMPALRRINAAEAEIRALGFYGADFEWERLMWPMLMIFASTCIRTSETIRRIKARVELPVRTDGGKYQPSGNARNDERDIWEGYSGLVTLHCGYGEGPDQLMWLGAYNFGGELARIVRNMDDGNGAGSALYEMYVSMAEGTFERGRLSAYQQDVLAQDIAEGAVRQDMKPDFVIIAAEQLEMLRSVIFAPIAAEIVEPVLEKIAGELASFARRRLPAGAKQFADFDTACDLSELCYRIIECAGRNGMLSLPENGEEGGRYTLVLVK